MGEELSVGTTLSHYRISRKLGAGGMGEVYLAEDLGLRRKVAIKVLPDSLSQDKTRLRRFEQEAFAASALNHPNILTIHEFGTAGETHYLASEYVEGETLRERLRRAPFTADEALDVAVQTARALAAAHEAQIIHRDIKPENVMVRRDGYVKVLDFGLAKLIGHAPHAAGGEPEGRTRTLLRTEAGLVFGTIPYMSPEQARGLPLDARTDVWSLGVVLYEMLAGRMPFDGETGTDIIASVLRSEPPPLSSYGRDIPAGLQRVVAKALSKDLAGRYQSAAELRADLERVRKQLEAGEGSSRVAADGLPENPGEAGTMLLPASRLVPASGDAVSGLTPQPQARARVFRTRAVTYAAVAVALSVLVSAAAYFGLRSSGDGGRIDSIAVLPFENLSGKPELASVSDGLSELLIDRLAELPQLKVISRRSSFAFRGAAGDLPAIAAKLGVRAVVTGSLAQNGDELLVRLEVVDVAEDRHLAGGSFRRKTGDLLLMQSEIAQATAEQLRVKLTDEQSKRLAATGTENSEAYRFYLSGLVELNGPEDVRGHALDYFEQAVALDPEFAAAWAEIAWVYWSRANGSSDPRELVPKAREATERALALDPGLAKAHVIKAMLNEYEYDWRGAEREYRRAIELSRNLAFARDYYAFFLSVNGRQDEALAELEELRVRDPVNQRLSLLQKGMILTQARKFDEALRVYQEAQTIEPGKEVPYFSLGYAYAGKGLYEEAAGCYRKSVELLGGEEKYSQPLVYLAATYAAVPARRGEARAILKRIESAGDYSSPALLAAVYSALGERDRALGLLEQAYVRHDPLLRFVEIGYEYDGLRADPRFKDLMRRIGFEQQ